MLLSHTAQREGELLTFLRGELALSSGLVKRLKWQNAFFLDGAPVHTNARVKPGQEITVRIEEAPEGFLPQALPIDILYEDAYMIALDKPAGQLVHPSPRKNEGTLANALLGYYERTDQPCGMQPAGEIALPVYKLGNGSLLRMVDPRGKRAVSRYRVISSDHQTSVLALNPVTGRTHQLRLHCKAAGFPILGDPQYCSPASLFYSDTHGLFRQQLLAARLELTHPVMGQPLVISSRQSVSAGDEQVHADARVLDGNVRAV